MQDGGLHDNTSTMDGCACAHTQAGEPGLLPAEERPLQEVRNHGAAVRLPGAAKFSKKRIEQLRQRLTRLDRYALDSPGQAYGDAVPDALDHPGQERCEQIGRWNQGRRKPRP